MADTKIEVILGMLFLTLSRADIRFAKKKLVWRAYSTAEALPTTQKIKIIDKKKFAAMVLNEEDEIFVIYMATTGVKAASNVHPSWQAQIRLMEIEEIIIPPKYADYTDVFSPDSAVELLKQIGIKNHPINLVDNKQPLFSLIYSLGPVDLETLKTYIETNLANGFIRPSKSPSGAPILFVRKKDGSFWLCVNYQGLNNLTIKNWYPMLLIDELLDCLGHAKRFTHLDLTNAYHQMRIQEDNE